MAYLTLFLTNLPMLIRTGTDIYGLVSTAIDIHTTGRDPTSEEMSALSAKIDEGIARNDQRAAEAQAVVDAGTGPATADPPTGQ